MATPTSRPIEELRLLDEEPGRFAFFAWQNLTIVTWIAPPDVSAVLRLTRVGEARIKESGAPLSDVHLVMGKLDFRASAIRDALVSGSRKAAPHLAAVAVLIGGSGFWASAMRSFITSVHVLVPGRFQLRLFGELDELAEWLPKVHRQRTGVAIRAAQLRTVLIQAQAHAGKRAA